jgi:demethoxyubiquinone hydroxylase (CLK1/Coq7/Cat5 family)
VWHENPLEAFIWFEKEFGQGRIDILIEKRNARVKVSKLEEKDIAKHYREQLKIIEQKRSDGDTGYIDFVSWQ